MSAWMLALSVGLVLAATDCNRDESCRPGTLFLNVRLGPYTTADELDVDVSVADSSDGGGTHETKLTLKPNSSSGGVEVDFPAGGYPTGKAVTVTLTLLSKGSQLAQRTLTISALPPSCTALTADFAATDGGTGGSAGGTAGIGAGGRAGGGGGLAGEGGSGTGGSGTGGSGTGGSGTGGSGTGGSGTGGRAGTGGAGTGGKAGAGGAGMGGAGTGGKAGTGGAGGACVPTGAENCFNNIDDDCDGKIDCADPDCNPKAQCVTADPTSAPIGTLTGAGSGAVCPTGYDKTTTIMSGPNMLDCAAGGGCGCKAPAVSCSTTLTSYNTTGLCEVGSSVAEQAGSFKTGQDNTCAIIPAWSTNGSGDIFGISTTKFAAQLAGGCTPTGSAIAPTLTFGSTGTFCATSTVGGGCGTGQVCVPVAPANSLCQLFDGAKTSCPGGAAAQPWYTGTSGYSSCGACTCGSPTGASCDNVLLSVGSDYGCSGFGNISSGGSQCFATGIYEPGVQFSGTPTAPSCQAQSAFTGTLAPSGPKTLCCP